MCNLMMTLSNGNIFRVTGPFCGKFTGHRWIHLTKASGVFFDLRLNKRLSKKSWGWWFKTPSCALWRHRNVWGVTVARYVTTVRRSFVRWHTPHHHCAGFVKLLTHTVRYPPELVNTSWVYSVESVSERHCVFLIIFFTTYEAVYRQLAEVYFGDEENTFENYVMICHC